MSVGINAWKQLDKALHATTSNTHTFEDFASVTSEDEWKSYPQNLKDNKLHDIFMKHVFAFWQNHLTSVIVPYFWELLSIEPIEEDEDASPIVEKMTQAIDYLYSQVKQFHQFLEILQKHSNTHTQAPNYTNMLHQLIRSCIFSVASAYFPKHVNSVFSYFVRSFHTIHIGGNINAEEDDEEANEIQEDDLENMKSALHKLDIFSSQLSQLQLSEDIFVGGCNEVLCHYIEKRIIVLCSSKFEENCLDIVNTWLEKVPFAFASSFFSKEEDNNEKIDTWTKQLRLFAYTRFADLRISELFNIVVEYPYSVPALNDLRFCLELTKQHQQLILSFRDALSARLLQPGASTNDIISQYISLIYSLRIVDPSGVMLESVVDPTRSYLKARPDTVRCIITSLTEKDRDHDLAKELYKERNGDDEFDDSDVDNEEGQQRSVSWVPDPIEADPMKTSRSRTSADVISMLVSIYGTKELFVNEYRTLLADRLLLKDSFETDEEVAQLELLKLRFGESSLVDCEVMLRDMMLSKRIKASIKGSLEEKKSEYHTDMLDVTIISKEFWPELQMDTFEVLPNISKYMTAFQDEYAVIKAPRLLEFQPNLGQVDIELEFEDRSLSLKVSPLHATIIGLFEDKNVWLLSDLANEMKIQDLDTFRDRIGFWVAQNVIKMIDNEDGEMECRLIENLGTEDAVALANTRFMASGLKSNNTLSDKDMISKENDFLEPYIIGVLNSYGKLSLHQIHERMASFSSQDFTYTKRPKDLHKLLATLANEGKILAQDGLYLRKPQAS